MVQMTLDASGCATLGRDRTGGGSAALLPFARWRVVPAHLAFALKSRSYPHRVDELRMLRSQQLEIIFRAGMSDEPQVDGVERRYVEEAETFLDHRMRVKDSAILRP